MGRSGGGGRGGYQSLEHTAPVDFFSALDKWRYNNGMAEERTVEIPITLRLTASARDRLTRHAALAGRSLAEYTADLVEVVSQHPPSSDVIQKNLSERFVALGISDDELAEELEVAKHAMREERRARRPA